MRTITAKLRIIAAKSKLGDLIIDFFVPLLEPQKHLVLRTSKAEPMLGD